MSEKDSTHQYHLKRWSLACRLVRNGMEYRYCRATGRHARVQAISLEVTRKCMGRCVMCNIWREGRFEQDLPVQEWVRLLSSPALSDLREIDLTGGEPFIRKDLTRLIEAVAGMKRSHFSHLASIAITTNGYLTERILRQVRKMIAMLSEAGIELVMVCAVDGIGEIHNEIRGLKHAWRRVRQTIERLVSLRNEWPNLIIGVKTTVVPRNVDELSAIADFIDQLGLFGIISPCIFTNGRYHNMEKRDDLNFGPKEIEKLKNFFSSDRIRWSYHREMLADYFEQRPIRKPCTAGFNYFFVRSNGDVYPCPLIPIAVGNFRERPLDRLARNSIARGFRRTITGRHSTCRVCTEPGLERYALPFEGMAYLRLMRSASPQAFFELHAHMGLHKYLE